MSKKEKRREINVMTIQTGELKDRLSKLEVITTGKEPKDNQVIEGAYGDARFEVTKEKSADCVLYVLRVFGPSKDARLSITSQFKTLLLDSKPIEFLASALPYDALFWNVKDIDPKQQKRF